MAKVRILIEGYAKDDGPASPSTVLIEDKCLKSKNNFNLSRSNKK